MHTAQNDQQVSILCAGPGLGFYVPGVVMNRQLGNYGQDSAVYVFEDFLRKDKKDNVAKAKINFHRNFSFALMGQQLAKDPSPYLDEARLGELLTAWQQQACRHFVVFSGFWIPVLEQYRQLLNGAELDIHLCHVDAANSTSWKLFETATTTGYNHIWFNNWDNRSITYFLNISGAEPLPFTERDNEFILHGGGWGMGTYKEKAAILNRSGLSLSIISYEQKDVDQMDPQNKYYMLDPAWDTWQTNAAGEHQFPPIGRIQPDGNIRYHINHAYPEVYNIIKKTRGIISKPGAGTLMDSLSSATPLLYLEPFGDYEAKNAALWQHYGLGMPLKDWMDAGCPAELLAKFHHNLLSIRSQAEDYVKLYIKNLNHGI